jgi:hypothetical protein
MSTTANHRFWQEAKRSSACHECTSGVWDPGKNLDSPATAGLRQLEMNSHDKSDRRVMVKIKFTGGTGRVCGAP